MAFGLKRRTDAEIKEDYQKKLSDPTAILIADAARLRRQNAAKFFMMTCSVFVSFLLVILVVEISSFQALFKGFCLRNSYLFRAKLKFG